MKSQNTSNNKLSNKVLARVVALLFGTLFILSGFEHYENHGSLGMTLAYIILGIGALGYAVLSFFDERRERIRKEKIEDAERIAKILSTPISELDDSDEALDKVIKGLEGKYK